MEQLAYRPEKAFPAHAGQSLASGGYQLDEHEQRLRDSLFRYLELTPQAYTWDQFRAMHQAIGPRLQLPSEVEFDDLE